MYTTKQMGQVHPQRLRQQGAGPMWNQIQQQPTITQLGPQVPYPLFLGNQMGVQPLPFATTGICQQQTIPPFGPQVPHPLLVGNQMGVQPHPFATTGIFQPHPPPRYPTYFPMMQGLWPPLWPSQPNVRRFPY